MKYLKKFENWGGEKEVKAKNQNLVDEHGREYDDDEEFEDEYHEEPESEFTHPLIVQLEKEGYKIREKSGNEDGSIATINSEDFEDWIKDNIEESDHNDYMRKNVPQKNK